MCRIPLYCSYKLWDEVVTLLQLDINIAEGILAVIAHSYHVVVEARYPYEDEHDDGDDYDCCYHTISVLFELNDCWFVYHPGGTCGVHVLILLAGNPPESVYIYNAKIAPFCRKGLYDAIFLCFIKSIVSFGEAHCLFMTFMTFR